MSALPVSEECLSCVSCYLQEGQRRACSVCALCRAPCAEQGYQNHPTSEAPSWEGLIGYDIHSDEIRACGFDCRLCVTITDTLPIEDHSLVDKTLHQIFGQTAFFPWPQAFCVTSLPKFTSFFSFHSCI